ncbi:hypothetical protein ANO11243_034080 [Dothideomycetidae sp. 11243]|nr:hypothetical protein ANO11243_034080 [fungal sp. No.11243]
MAQGAFKAKGGVKKSVIKPKKAKLVQQHKLKKKQSAGLTALTEKSLAERAGHLEMLKGGKKDSKDSNKSTKAKK